MSAIDKWLSAHRLNEEAATFATSATKRNVNWRVNGLDVAPGLRRDCDKSEEIGMSQRCRARAATENLQVHQEHTSDVADVANVAGPVCSVCSEGIREPVTHWWGGERSHPVCGEFEFQAAKARGRYAS